MIVVSDNTATNMLIDLLGGVSAVNQGVSSLGYPGIRLDHKICYPPPPLVVAHPHAVPEASGPLGTATPAEFCRLAADLQAGAVVDAAASAEMITVLRHQQSQSLMPRSYLDVAEPSDLPGPDGPAIANKTGSVGGCRVDTGLLYLPSDGGTVAYCAAADRLDDRTMTALAEGNEILGRLGCDRARPLVAGPGPVPVRPGWLSVGPPPPLARQHPPQIEDQWHRCCRSRTCTPTSASVAPLCTRWTGSAWQSSRANASASWASRAAARR